MEVWQVIIAFGLIVVAFDAIWATIAKEKGFTYAKGTWVSFLIYAIAGATTSQKGSFVHGLVSGLGVAGIEATIGWWVSWVIGPGRIPDTISRDAYPRAIISALIGVMFTGALFGLLGAFLKFVIFGNG